MRWQQQLKAPQVDREFDRNTEVDLFTIALVLVYLAEPCSDCMLSTDSLPLDDLVELGGLLCIHDQEESHLQDNHLAVIHQEAIVDLLNHHHRLHLHSGHLEDILEHLDSMLDNN